MLDKGYVLKKYFIFLKELYVLRNISNNIFLKTYNSLRKINMCLKALYVLRNISTHVTCLKELYLKELYVLRNITRHIFLI